MAAVNQILSRDGLVLYEVEKSNWEHPGVRTFDERGSIPLGEHTIIDLVLLGEGYLATDQASFESHISSWYDNTFAKWPYSQFTGAFRVRALFTPSTSRANVAGDGYYGIPLESSLAKLDLNTSDEDFREKLYEALSFIKDNDHLNALTWLLAAVVMTTRWMDLYDRQGLLIPIRT